MTKPLRILMAGPDPRANGGVATVVSNYVHGSLASNVDLRYIVTMCEGSKVAKLARAVTAYRSFSAAVSGFDVVHLHVSKGASITRKYLLALSARRHGIPYIVHLHAGEFPLRFDVASPRRKRLVVDFFSGAERVIVLSEVCRTYLVTHVCSADRVVVLPNAVEMPVGRVPANTRTVLFLGRLREVKAPDTLLRAAVHAAVSIPDLNLLFAGDGDIERYRNLARSLGIEKRCTFLGWVSRGLEELFNRCSVLCLPSRAEGMPMSLLEAMASGMAVVATPVGAIPQVIEDGVNGLLVPVDNDRALAEALARLLEDRDLRERLGSEARRTVFEKYGMQVHVRALVELYRCAADGREDGHAQK